MSSVGKAASETIESTVKKIGKYSQDVADQFGSKVAKKFSKATSSEVRDKIIDNAIKDRSARLYDKAIGSAKATIDLFANEANPTKFVDEKGLKRAATKRQKEFYKAGMAFYDEALHTPTVVRENFGDYMSKRIGSSEASELLGFSDDVIDKGFKNAAQNGITAGSQAWNNGKGFSAVLKNNSNIRHEKQVLAKEFGKNIDSEDIKKIRQQTKGFRYPSSNVNNNSNRLSDIFDFAKNNKIPQIALGVGTTAWLVNKLSDSRGQQSNGQLYGQGY